MILQSKDGTQSIDFEIPTKYKKIAVNCSGGADSSMLLYMVAKYVVDNNMDTEINVLTCSSHIKDRCNGRKADAVINYIAENVSSDVINLHYVYFRDKPFSQYFHDMESKLFEDGRADLFVSGITSNPPEGTVVENIQGDLIDISATALPNRNGDNHTIWGLSTTGGADFWSPFANSNKRFVADMYDLYGVRETLLPLTRSCEKKTDLNDPFDPAYEKTACGICWWCLERKWAFGYF